MRPLEDIYFIRDRVLAWIAEHPPQGPLLEEAAPVVGTCKKGHLSRIRANGSCTECEWWRSQRKREAYHDPLHAPSQAEVS